MRPCRLDSAIHVLHGPQRVQMHDTGIQIGHCSGLRGTGLCMMQMWPPIRVTCREGQVRRDGRDGDVTSCLGTQMQYSRQDKETVPGRDG
jgi:hypothetical protein